MLWLIVRKGERETNGREEGEREERKEKRLGLAKGQRTHEQPARERKLSA